MARKRANGEGTIRKRADGSWEARYCADGKRHSVYGRTQAEVRKKLTEVSVTIDHGDFREDSGLTLGQWLTMWHRDYLGNVKLGTADTYEMQIRVHIIPALGDVKLSALRTPMIQRLYNKKREEGLSPKSIKNIHGCLHKALDVAVRIGYLSKNPSGNCILPRIEQAEIHPLDTPELSKLLAFLKGHEHEALIVTAIFTGLRSGELLGLTWDSVDFENGLIRVTKQLAQPRKKGEVFRFATPKNSKPRTIAPAPTVFQVLKKHKEEQEAQRKALGPAWNDGGFPNLVFTHPDGSHLSQPTAWKILHKILVAAGIDAHRFHDLRHPYVKHMTKIFSLRLMDSQAQAYPDARRKTRGACQLLRGGQSQSPVRPLCNRKRFSYLPPQSKISWILYATSMRLSGYTSTRSISSSASSVVSVSASKIALDASLRLSCRACSSCFCFACANTAA